MNYATFYDVQGNLPASYTQLTASHHGHPWPGLLQVAGEEKTDPMKWAKDHALYLAGGGLIAVGALAWAKGWFR